MSRTLEESSDLFSSEPELTNYETEFSPVAETSGLSLDDVAEKLLKDKFILTALELHAELAERRKEIPRLRTFFSNPGNFEYSSKLENVTFGLGKLPEYDRLFFV